MTEVIREVQSSRDPSVIYKISRGRYGLQCSCPGFLHNQDCRHLREFIGELDQLIAECRKIEDEYHLSKDPELLKEWSNIRDKISELQKLICEFERGEIPRGFRR